MSLYVPTQKNIHTHVKYLTKNIYKIREHWCRTGTINFFFYFGWMPKKKKLFSFVSKFCVESKTKSQHRPRVIFYVIYKDSMGGFNGLVVQKRIIANIMMFPGCQQMVLNAWKKLFVPFKDIILCRFYFIQQCKYPKM